MALQELDMDGRLTAADTPLTGGGWLAWQRKADIEG